MKTFKYKKSHYQEDILNWRQATMHWEYTSAQRRKIELFSVKIAGKFQIKIIQLVQGNWKFNLTIRNLTIIFVMKTTKKLIKDLPDLMT